MDEIKKKKPEEENPVEQPKENEQAPTEEKPEEPPEKDDKDEEILRLKTQIAAMQLGISGEWYGNSSCKDAYLSEEK